MPHLLPERRRLRTAVIAPGKHFKPLATNRLDGQCLASIAVSDRAMFVRSTGHVNRLETGSSAATPFEEPAAKR